MGLALKFDSSKFYTKNFGPSIGAAMTPGDMVLTQNSVSVYLAVYSVGCNLANLVQHSLSLETDRLRLLK